MADNEYRPNKNLLPGILAALEASVEAGAVMTEKALKKAYSKRGTVLDKYGVMRSAPGDAPAKQTGDLMDSVTHETTVDADGAEAVIGPNTPYDLAQEFGYAPHNLAPRPAVRPTWANIETPVEDRMLAKFATELGKIPKGGK